MDMEGEDKQAEVTAAKSREQQESMTGAMREQSRRKGGHEGPPEDCSEAVEGLACQPGREMFEFSYFYVFILFFSFYCFIVFDVGLHVVQADLKLMTDLRLALNSFSSCLQLSRAGIPVIHTTPSKLIFSETSL